MTRTVKYTLRGRLYWEWRCHGYLWQLIMTKSRQRLVKDWWPTCPHPFHAASHDPWEQEEMRTV